MALPFEIPPVAFLNIFLDLWKFSRQNRCPAQIKKKNDYPGYKEQSVLIWKKCSHMSGCSMASFNLERGKQALLIIICRCPAANEDILLISYIVSVFSGETTVTLIIISVVCCSKPTRPNALLIISSLISSIEDP